MRIFIVDDHPLFVGGLESLLARRPDMALAGTASSGEEALQRVPATRPDLIILDLKLPGMNGLETLDALKVNGVEAPVALLTVSDEEEDLVRALRSGAAGYLLKDAEPEELDRSLDRILAGETVVAPRLTTSLAAVVRSGGSEEAPQGNLTAREMEVLRHITRGESNKVIARELDISPDTVKLHVKNLLGKLGVSSRVSAAIEATRRGLVEEASE